MKGLARRLESLSVPKRALLAQELASRLEVLEAERCEPIAVVGMACRFPGGANNPEAFWHLLSDGVDAVRDVPPERWDAAAFCDANRHAAGKTVTRAGGFIEDVAAFDANFFHISPHDAERMDPQHRWVLEVGWEALEDAGHDPDELVGSAGGVFLGIIGSEYAHALAARIDAASVDGALALGTAPGMAPGRLSHVLGLHGPSMAVDTQCSSSLVAIHLACQSLRLRECDLALAGGVQAMLTPLVSVSLSQAGALAPDARCKAFDSRADGYGRGEGCGIVVLKRLSDALADGDRVVGVIRGSAVRHDGRSAGLGVPNGTAQQSVVRAALAAAGVRATDIQYLEAHGTGTPLGDPIEMHAVTATLCEGRTPDRALWVGSAKSNIGHGEAAAGVASLIKTALALRAGVIPPHLHFREPNPHLALDGVPVRIPTAPTPWPGEAGTRIAGVSSFGLGGTIAHLVLSEPPAADEPSPSRPFALLVLSAGSRTALDSATSRLASHLRAHPDLPLADVAYTLEVGRKSFPWRRAVVCRDRDDALAALEGHDPGRLMEGLHVAGDRSVVFMFSGVGDHYPEMAAGLYRTEAVFRAAVDECCALLAPHLGRDLRDTFFRHGAADEGDRPAALGSSAAIDLRRMLRRGGAAPPGPVLETIVAQPVVFVVNYATARLWMSWGIRPQAMIGHSIGEFVAACIAEVFSLPDVLHLVAARARLIQALPPGRMLAVNLSEDALRPLLDDRLSLSAVNAPALCVVAGPPDDVARLDATLAAQGVTRQMIPTGHAFHSRMMEPMVEEFRELLSATERRPPTIPFVSNVHGDWITDAEATAPEYWARHVCATVRFSQGIEKLAGEPRVLLEVGPGQSLTSFALQHPCPEAGGRLAIPSIRPAYDRRSDVEFLLTAIGRLWLAGVQPSWAAVHAHEKRRRVPLPTYPFERQRYWLDVQQSDHVASRPAEGRARGPIEDWFTVPVWKQSPPTPHRPVADAPHVLVLQDESGVGHALAARLRGQGHVVSTVVPGAGFRALGDDAFEVRPTERTDYEALLRHLRDADRRPTWLFHLWTVDPPPTAGSPAEDLAYAQDRGFFSLLAFVQALVATDAGPRRLVVASSGTHAVLPDDEPCPPNATLVGPCRVIPAEHPEIACTLVDVERLVPGSCRAQDLAMLLAAEAAGSSPDDPIVAYRAGERWVPRLDPVRLEPWLAEAAPLRGAGVYLITGGLGGIGLGMAHHLAQRVRARLALVGRTGLPERASWDEHLATSPDDAVSQRIRSIQEIERAGGEVLVLAADVTDRDRMREAVAAVKARFGRIDGVIHAAGVPGAGLLCTKERAAAEAVLGPKVRGTLVLDEVLAGERLDFLVLFGSVFSILGGVGQVDYCAANAFLNTFAAARSRRGRRTVSIAWGAWKWDAWQNRLLAALPEVRHRMEVLRERFGIELAEGADALCRALGTTFPCLGVSALSIEALREQVAALTLPELLAPSVSPGPHHARPALTTAYVAPEDDVQRRIATIFQDTLGLEEVGLHDDFLELGGNSLLATRIIARLNAELRADLAVSALFEGPTIAQLARLVAQRDGDAPRVPALERLPRGTSCPLSPPQERLWYLEQVNPGTPAYNYVAAVRLSGPLHAGALGDAITELIHRHEILRTSFPAVDGTPVQEIAAATPACMERLDLREVEPDGRDREWRRLARDFGHRPFELTHGPLFRTLLVQLDAQEHVLVAAAHHVVIDHLSVPVFVREIGALYEGGVSGRPAVLPELPAQYADFAVWYRERLEGPRAEAVATYWKGVFDEEPRALDLPTDRPRPAMPSNRGARQDLELPAELIAQLEALGRREGTTLYMTLLAAFATLLARYSGRTDVVVGAPIDLRTEPALQGSIGFFIETLALRLDLSADPSFAALLARVRKAATGAYDHRDMPFDRLVRALNVKRDMSRTPLYQATFLVVDSPIESVRFADLTLEPLDLDRGAAMTDVSLLVERRVDGAVARLEYATDLFDADRIARLLRHYRRLLEGIAADPQQRLSELPLLTDDERHQLLVEWVPPRTEIAPNRCLHHLVEEQAHRTPEARALVWENERLSYRALNLRANQLAHHLRRLGVGAETLVGLCVERSVDMVVAILGILKAGAAYLPLSAADPPERVAAMLADAKPSLVVTQEAVQEAVFDRLPELAVRCLRLDTDRQDIAREPTDDPPRETNGSNLAYVLYTSGSTGAPKGVAVEHHSAVNLITWAQGIVGDEDVRGVMASTSIGFDPSVLELFLPLSRGGAVILARNVMELPYLAAADEVTLMVTVPSVMNELLRLTDLPPAVRTVILGAEALSAELVTRVYHQKGVRQVFDFYGPTETTVASSFDLRGDGDPPTIGRPIANTRLYVLDAQAKLLPVGVPGELYIGGAGLARGYLDRPDLTARSFVVDPIGTEPGQRLYRTGDLARYRPDGKLEFVGRVDEQVKVRGLRIELGEIEATLRRHPQVREAVAIVHVERGGDKRLWAYVVAQGDTPPPLDELRGFLRARLPRQMVPTTMAILDRLPLTRTGKVDRAALPAIADTTAGGTVATHQEPRTPTEALLCTIWREVLGIARVGIHDDFFEVGGDSIFAIRMIGRANQAGLRLSPRMLVDRPTIAELATEASLTRPPVAESVSGPVVLTPIQRWLLEPTPPDLDELALRFVLKLRKPLDPELLERAFQHLVAHHDGLRLRLRPSTGGWEQWIAPAADASPPFVSRVDLAGRSADEQAEAVREAAATLPQRLHLATGPIGQAQLFDFGADRPGRLLVVVHHFAFDFVSAAICLGDLEQVYTQLSRGERPALPQKTTSFQHWADRLTHHARSHGLDDQLPYWARQLGNGAAPLPTDFSCPAGDVTEGSTRRVVTTVGPDETAVLLSERVRRDLGHPPRDIILTAVAGALARWVGSTSLSLDLIGHGREHVFPDVDLSRTIGFFTTLSPLHVDLAGASTPRDALAAVSRQVAERPQHGIGYGLLRWLSEDRSTVQRLSGLPQPQIVFDYLGQFDQLQQALLLFAADPELTGRVSGPRTPRHHALEIAATIIDDRLRVQWDYSAALHCRETIESVAAMFVEELHRLIS